MSLKVKRLYDVGNVLCALSMGICTLVLSSDLSGTILWGLVALISFLIALKYSFQKAYVQTVLCRLTALQAVVACIFSACIFDHYSAACEKTIKLALEALPIRSYVALQTVLPSVFLLAVFCLSCIVIQRAQTAISRFGRGMSNAEKRFIIISSVIWILLIFLAYRKTTIFYSVYSGDVPVYFDALYNLDSGFIYCFDQFMNLVHSENDVRQLMFALFSTPFSVVAKTLGNLVFLGRSFSYAAGLASIQIIIIQATALLLARMAIDEEHARWRPLFWILFSLSFSTVLFSLCLEQYVFSTFWAILLIYAYIKNYSGRDLIYIVATGSIITSGILFPLITKFENKKAAFCDICKAFFKYCAFLVMFGYSGYLLYQMIPDFQKWIASSANTSIQQKILQFISFARTIFLYPASRQRLYLKRFPLGTVSLYEAAPVTAVSIIGLIVLALVIVGFILNRKKTYAKVCFGWVLLSAFVIAVVGWGIPQSATIVYSYYFGWAYISLTIMGIMRVLNKWPLLTGIIIGLIILAVLCVNLYGTIDIMRFSLLNYAVVG